MSDVFKDHVYFCLHVSAPLAIDSSMRIMYSANEKCYIPRYLKTTPKYIYVCK